MGKCYRKEKHGLPVPEDSGSASGPMALLSLLVGIWGLEGRPGVQGLAAPGRVEAVPGQRVQSISNGFTLLPTPDVSLSPLCSTYTLGLPEH